MHRMAQEQGVRLQSMGSSAGSRAHRLVLWSWWALVAWTQFLAMFPGWLFAERARTLFGTFDDFEGPPSAWVHVLSMALLWVPAVVVYAALSPSNCSRHGGVLSCLAADTPSTRAVRLCSATLVGGTIGLHLALISLACAGLLGPDIGALEFLFLGVVAGFLLRDWGELGCARLLLAPVWALSVAWWVWPACAVWNHLDPQGWSALVARWFG